MSRPGTSVIFPPPDRPFLRTMPIAPSSLNERSFLDELLNSSIVLPEDFQGLPLTHQEGLVECKDKDAVLTMLVERKLMTEYQAARVRAGTIYGLVLGNYRVLDRLGAGAMAVVFKGEHIEMRRTVAIKVMPQPLDLHPKLVSRFTAEMRTIAQLQHPNIVAAFDAGKTVAPDPDSPVLRYIVMEYVAGENLEGFVNTHGPIDPATACDFIHQIASALVEANKLKMVHRDIKPSNILITPEGQAKLLDFGLVHHCGTNMTDVGTIVGTVDFMAPEQAQNANAVDIRTDLYGLGGTLFWCLTAQTPFPSTGTVIENLARRLTQPPPSVRSLKPAVHPDLDAVVTRLLAVNPAERYATPQELMRALLPFIKPDSHDDLEPPSDLRNRAIFSEILGHGIPAKRVHRILIVDDEPAIRSFCCQMLQTEGMQCDEAGDGIAALAMVQEKAYDLLLVDNHMPLMNGLEVLRQLRETPPIPHLKVVMISGESTADEMAKMLLAGADDYLTKPFSLIQMKSRIKTALGMKDAQDHSDVLHQHLLAVNAEMEHNLTARNIDLVHARNALVLALAKLVEHRDSESGAHLTRLQRYSQCLAEEAAGMPTFAGQIDDNFIEMVGCCAPLHDIGKVALPDYILLKPGQLTHDERILMQAHTIIGADTLAEVANQHGAAVAFLQMGIDIARHHHERFDGAGYPDRLAGNDIPLAARIVCIADVYDALRSRRIYKPALSHRASLQLMTESSPGQFDPALIRAFTHCARQFEKIFQEVPG
jgi:response regulator RpfG family c-di-GMP phosphodiesterase/serine/threonine protein kinase